MGGIYKGAGYFEKACQTREGLSAKGTSRHPKLVKIASSVDNNLIHFDF